MTKTDKKIADRIIEQLNEGIIPWRKGWHNASSNVAFSRVTKKPYVAINQMLLPYGGEWATFRQWNKLGAKIKKGEHPFPIVGSTMKEEKKIVDGEEVVKKHWIQTCWLVFHISQVEGIEPLEKTPEFKHEDIISADECITEYVEREGIKFMEESSNSAWYCEKTDELRIPKRSQFDDINEFYSTAFHEMIHSTGHHGRLKRDLTGRMGEHKYGLEELIAELGSAMLMDDLGIETESTFKNSVAYIQSWINAIKENPEIVLKANKKAKKAVAFIKNNE